MTTPAHRRMRLLAGTLLIAALSTVGAATADAGTSIVNVDDQGPDDNPGQKDLNQVSILNPNGNPLLVEFQLDDTSVPGGNTMDGCALFDTDGDGLANYALCHTINDEGTQTTTGYQCTSDFREDRCTGPEFVPTASSSTSSVVADSDPFAGEAAHRSSEACDTDPDCYDDDTVVSLSVALSDFGGAAVADLINVCSYPSMQPNSDPSDCVLGPSAADLSIAKTSSVDTIEAGGSFTYDLVVTNAGPSAALAVVVTDSVPTALTVTGVASEDMTCSSAGNDIECTAPSLALDASATITVSVDVPANAVAATLTNVAIVASGTTDPDPTDNESSDDIVVTVPATSTTTTTTSTPAIVAPTTTANPAVVTLPQTGSTETNVAISLIAGALLLLGAGAVMTARRTG